MINRKVTHPNLPLNLREGMAAKKQITKNAFTLVELIVVITILAILWTIWFIAYSWYVAWARDTNRVSQLKSISDWLEIYTTKNILPLPDDYRTITSSWETIWYQWYIWKNILDLIEYTSEWVDPKDKSYFNYYLTKDKKQYQLMAYLEESNNVAWILTNQVFAWDYANRYVVVYGKKLWILTDENNIPIQELWSWDLELKDNTTKYLAHIWKWESLNLSWDQLRYILLSKSVKKYKAPWDCPEWFIWVPWNAQFNQKWFCVAQYEMTYLDANSPDSTWWWTDWNTMHYVAWKKIVSKSWKYPIADITQVQAISACASMWAWYHLITNNEWMSVARNIELEKDNWSGWALWVWNLYNWVSNDTSLGCNKTWWNTESRSYATKTWAWSDSVCNNKRSHKLSNGQRIWDLSGNVWEHVNKANTLDWSNYNVWQTSMTWSSSWTNWDDDGIYALEDMKKYGSLYSLWKSNWMWNLYYANWVANNIFIRGTSANLASYTGVFTISLRWTSTHQYRYVGFRCAR